MSQTKEQNVLDFTSPAHQLTWESIDDRIMGGCSQSHGEITAEGTLLFAGTVSLENQGGFASIRSQEGEHDLGGSKALKIRVKGDGKRYKLGLRIDVYFDGVTYLSEFTTTAGQWQEITLPLESFAPTHHGKVLANAAALDLTRVKSFVFLIGSRQEGPFELNVAWIRRL